MRVRFKAGRSLTGFCGKSARARQARRPRLPDERPRPAERPLGAKGSETQQPEADTSDPISPGPNLRGSTQGGQHRMVRKTKVGVVADLGELGACIATRESHPLLVAEC